MDELVARVARSVGLDREPARQAIGMILAFLRKEGPAAEVGRLIAALPGAQTTMAQADTASGDISLGMIGGGGIMALGGQLMGAGLSMAQIQALGRELFAYGRETAGEDTMGSIVGAVPGLAQFV